jgi:hypothetical protein
VVNRKKTNNTVVNRKKTNNTVVNRIKTNNTVANRKRDKKKTMDCKIIHRKLRIEQQTPPPLKITRVNLGATVR